MVMFKGSYARIVNDWMVIFLLTTNIASASVAISSVSRTQATRWLGVATEYGQSQGFFAYDYNQITKQINDANEFDYDGNLVAPDRININSQTSGYFQQGNFYAYYGSFNSDVISIQLHVSDPQPFSFEVSGDGFDAADYPVSFSLSGPNGQWDSLDANWSDPYHYHVDGILSSGTFTLFADFGFNTDPGSSNGFFFPYNYSQTDHLTLALPEPTCGAILLGVVFAGEFGCRRRSRIA